mmetsp:Transcript_10541/g.23971  ORF Transcript_10541/g.23971 Transcript_10541/m.23971 type:complete len:91 (-) Transcript_10541:31-303(-)
MLKGPFQSPQLDGLLYSDRSSRKCNADLRLRRKLKLGVLRALLTDTTSSLSRSLDLSETERCIVKLTGCFQSPVYIMMLDDTPVEVSSHR